MTIGAVAPILYVVCAGRTSDGNRSGVVGRAMKAERQKPAEEMGRVVKFTPRTAPRKLAAPPDPSPISNLGRYARGGDDDYRHRMLMNALAFIVCLLLALAGIWLVSRIAEMR